MAHHHLLSRPDTVAWGYWDATRAPVLRIESGDIVMIDTLSAEPGDVPEDLPFAAGLREVHAETPRGPGPHFLTGPIHVAGAAPGDALDVKVLDLTLRDAWGWTIQKPGKGTLPSEFPERRVTIIPLDAARMTAHPPWGGSLPLAPFLGAFGVAPAPERGRVTSVIPDAFGGNMDNKELGVGVTVRFPVFNEGALFSAGDGHAAQGDGEVCVTAIETSLTATLQFTVRKGVGPKVPRAETAASWITMGFDEDLDRAAEAALREMIDLLATTRGMARTDAYSLCSIAADLRVTQLVNVKKGVHCVLRKAVAP